MKTKTFIKGIITSFSAIAILSGFSSCKKDSSEKFVCTYDGAKIDWTDVDSSTSYTVDVKDGENNTNNTVSNSELEYDIQNETAEVSIQAKDSDGNEVYSTSTPFSFKRLAVFDTPTYSYGTISWSKVDSAAYYLVKIGDNQPVKVYETSYKLNPGVNNNVSIKPVLDISKVTDGTYYSYSIPMSYEVMATPSFKSFDKSSKTFTWDQVKNSGGYYICIEKDGQVIHEQGGIGSDATYYNDYAFNDEGTYTVKLATKANSNANSYDSAFYEQKIVRLSAPKNLKTEEEKSSGAILLSWDAVEGATGYKVKLPNGNTAETTQTYYKYLSDATSSESNYNFKVYSISNDLYTLDSLEYSTVDVVRLGMVKNVKIQAQMLTWDNVDKAQSYIVSIDGTLVSVDKNEYYFDGYTGSHKVKVKACGNGTNLVSSSYSNEQTIYKLSKPTNLTISNGVLTWDPVANSQSYRIIITNGNSHTSNGSYSATTNSITINRSDLKESQTIQVQAIGDGNTIADSEFSDSYNTFVLASPIVSVSKEGIVWTKVDNATSYTVYLNDYKKNVTGTALNLSEEDIPAGSYSIKVIANGNLVHYFDSDESQSISAKLLAKPTVSNNETETGVAWKTVISAYGYNVRIDDGSIISLGSDKRNYDVTFKTSGIHTVSVRAEGDGVDTITSGWTTIEVEVYQLPTVTNVKYSKNEQKVIIQCNEVENAKGYKFKIGGVIYNSDSNTYEYTIKNPSDLTISVGAVGTGYKYLDSNFTKEETITILNTPSKASFTKEDSETYLLSWSAVNKAVSYTVVLTKKLIDGSTSSKTYTLGVCELLIDTTDCISVSATIVVNGDNNYIFSSSVYNVVETSIK